MTTHEILVTYCPDKAHPGLRALHRAPAARDGARPTGLCTVLHIRFPRNLDTYGYEIRLGGS